MLYNSSEITFGEDRGGKGRHFKSKFFESGLCSYEGCGGKVILIKKETIDKFAQSMVGCPLIVEHADVTDDNVKSLEVGRVSRVWYEPSDGWYWCDGILTDSNAETLITEKGYSVSCAYDVLDKDKRGGVWHDIPYDEEILDGDFRHLAIVSAPRYRDATILLNSTDRKKKMLNVFNSKKLRNSEDKGMDKEEMKENAASEDKRKLIDEIGGILKDKISEEDWRTVMQKAEDLAYKGSEDDAKDNESDVEDEKDEDKKNACVKKNEADDENKEEDEKENRRSRKNESDEDDKERKDNNSSFRKIEKLHNSYSETESAVFYEPESVRLARGKNY